MPTMGAMDADAQAQDAAAPLLAELVGQVMRHAVADGVQATAVPGLHLVRLSAPGSPLPALYEPGLVLVVQGRKRARLGTQELVYDPLHCLVVSVTVLPVSQVEEASPQQPYLCLRLQVDAQQITQLLLDAQRAGRVLGVAPAGVAPGADAACGLQVTRTPLAVLDAALRLMRLLDSPADLPLLAPLVQREILYRVLGGELGPRLRALAAADGHAARIGRAVDLLRSRFDEPLRVDDLAEVAAMSTSSFHLHFKQVTAMSPLQYQKHLRLHQARGLMLAQGLDAAAAAHRVGYESASQFSREYRRLFGAPPRAEVRQWREAVAAEGDGPDAGSDGGPALPR